MLLSKLKIIVLGDVYQCINDNIFSKMLCIVVVHFFFIYIFVSFKSSADHLLSLCVHLA